MNGKSSKPIVIQEKTKIRLDSLKLVPCETYDSVIERALAALEGR